ncbi:hypothetical protein M0K31_RS21765 [Enterobacter cloacae]|nr:hypothetical protein [Enterobacter cloacae]
MKSSDMVEALEINEAIETMIADRQAIAERQRHHLDVLQETWDLVRLGHQYKDAGKDWYRWAKATAISLWESAQSRAEELKDNGVSL